MSDNIVQHPRAALLAHKLDRAQKNATEKKARAQHRKWLKETKWKRDRERRRLKREKALYARIDDILWRTAQMRPATVTLEEAVFAIAEAIETAAETSAARAAGFKSWAALKAAEDRLSRRQPPASVQPAGSS